MRRNISGTTVLSLSVLGFIHSVNGFTVLPKGVTFSSVTTRDMLRYGYVHDSSFTRRFLSSLSDEEEEDDDEDEDEEDDLYSTLASSEFNEESTTDLDWGSALGSLRKRVGDIEQGKTGLSNALFRLMTKESPNEAIGRFVKSANPEILGAMSGAVSGLLGGLANPAMGIETKIKANGRRVASLCFQLQMTGYMFRNAEYVVALKELLKIKEDNATVKDFKEAFDRLDSDGSGYIESSEIVELLSDVYDGVPPAFEVETFLQFFDSNKDGRISWQEFEQGLGAMTQEAAARGIRKSLPGASNSNDDEDEDEDEHDLLGEPSVSGTVEVELEDGSIKEVEAKDYIQGLKDEAQALKEALQSETGQTTKTKNAELTPGSILSSTEDNSSSVTAFIASLGGDFKQLTKGISPEVVDTMKLLVNYVLEGSSTGNNTSGTSKSTLDMEKEMELPGSAMQQLALWQLVLGYRLREAEAMGDYKKLLDN